MNEVNGRCRYLNGGLLRSPDLAIKEKNKAGQWFKPWRSAILAFLPMAVAAIDSAIVAADSMGTLQNRATSLAADCKMGGNASMGNLGKSASGFGVNETGSLCSISSTVPVFSPFMPGFWALSTASLSLGGTLFSLLSSVIAMTP